MQRKQPAKRAFQGLAGSPLVTPTSANAPSKAAQRAARFRGKQGDDFKKQERLRKKWEREEEKRKAQVAEVARDQKNYPDGPMLTVTNTDGKQVRVETGGYTGERVTDKKPPSRRGAAPDKYGKNSKVHDVVEHEDQFVRKAFQSIRRPRAVAAMMNFIYSNTERHHHRSSLTVCSHCKLELTPFRSEVSYTAFAHFHDKHPELFHTMMAKVAIANQKRVCPEDHDGMVKRQGHGTMKVQCRKCRKILWRPGGAFGRSP